MSEVSLVPDQLHYSLMWTRASPVMNKLVVNYKKKKRKEKKELFPMLMRVHIRLTEAVCLASRAATCGFVCLLEGDVYWLGVKPGPVRWSPAGTKTERKRRRTTRLCIWLKTLLELLKPNVDCTLDSSQAALFLLWTKSAKRVFLGGFFNQNVPVGIVERLGGVSNGFHPPISEICRLRSCEVSLCFHGYRLV